MLSAPLRAVAGAGVAVLTIEGQHGPGTVDAQRAKDTMGELREHQPRGITGQRHTIAPWSGCLVAGGPHRPSPAHPGVEL